MGDGKTRFPSAAWRSWSKALPLDDVDFEDLQFDRSLVEPLLKMLRDQTMTTKSLKAMESFLRQSFTDMPPMLGEEGGSGAAALVPYDASADVSNGGGSIGQASGGKVGGGEAAEEEAMAVGCWWWVIRRKR